MQNAISKILSGLVLVLFMPSCDDSDDANVTAQEDAAEVEAFEDYVGIMSIMRDLESFSLSGVSTDNLIENPGGRTSGRLADGGCFSFDFERSEDGMFVYTYDFGEGCESRDMLLQGKVTITVGMGDEDSFFQQTVYESFQSDDWSINGTETVEGTYILDISEGFDLIVDIDYTLERDLDLSRCGKTQDYSLASTAVVSIDEQAETVTGFEETLIDPENITYTTFLVSALVRDFSCNPKETFAYTEGITNTVYNSGEFTIDYGNGTCDNLVTITENGEPTEQDITETLEFNCDEG